MPVYRRVSCLVLFLVCGSLSVGQAHQWWFGETEGFDVASNASSKRTQYLVRELQVVRSVFEALNPGLEGLAPARLQVIVCGGNDTMDRIMPLYQGQPKRLGGLFSHDEQGWFICINGRGSLKQSRRIAYHEYVHFLMDRQQMAFPAWLSEGIAEVFSTVEVRFGNQITVGRAPSENLALLRRSQLIPLERLFAIGYESPEYNSQKHGQGLFYAQSWALAHYLLFGNDDLPEGAYQELLKVFRRQGRIHEPQFRAITGWSFDEAESRLVRYIRQSAFKRIKLDDIPLPEEVNVELRPGLSGEDSLVLGRVRLATRGPSAAAGYFLHAYKCLPESAEAAASIGFLDYRNENYKEADKYFSQALARGSDSPAHLLYAVLSKIRIHNPHGNLSYRNLERLESETLMQLLSRARDLGESRPLLYQTIGRVGLNSVLKPSTHCLELVMEGVDRYQNDPSLGYYYAMLLDRKGRVEEAKKLLDQYANFEMDYETRLIFQPILEGADRS